MAMIKGREKVEQYARMLFDAGVSSGRAGADLVQWRHAAKFTPDELPPDRTIEEAAVIAAYYSKAKTSSRADVDYTFIKFVKKPAGSKPGMVIFTHNYTITVKPDEELVMSLIHNT